MRPINAYNLLQRLSPDALDAIETMIARGWSPANIAHMLRKQYRSEIGRLILPAALYAANRQQEAA